MKLVNSSITVLTEVPELRKMTRRIEEIGRVCYKSEGNICRGSEEVFCKMLIKNGHLSVLEHESITVRIVANRGLTHELVRHRLASYSQESTRFCSYDNHVSFILPDKSYWEPGVYYPDNVVYLMPKGAKVIQQELANIAETGLADRIWFEHMGRCERAYQRLLRIGQQPQIARGVLPIDLKTEIVVTCNLRQWLWMFKQRRSKKAHPQIRGIMQQIREQFRIHLDCIFSDESLLA